MNKATIYNVAYAANVSLATVSRTLNNPQKVKPETRERVLRVIKELGYKPNAFAKGLASKKSTTVGVIVPDMSRASIAEMLNGIAVEARKYDYSLLLYVLKNEKVEEAEMLREVVASQVDGILYMNDEINEEQYALLNTIQDDYKVPIVLANTLYPYDNKLVTICIDYFKAAYEVTNRLIEEGRQHIYLLTTARKYMVNDLKEEGYLKAMKEARLTPRVVRTSGDISVNTIHFDELFKEPGIQIDGVVAVRDSIAVSFVNSIIERSKKVPDDISVYGFQNTKYASLSRPKLSCVDIPIIDIGAKAMALLKQEIDGETVDVKFNVLPHSIIERQTTKSSVE
ncbi:MAG: LacI family DNA-binding transcriptional regulator [Candidatus Izemoplasmatales bacterium]|jgi:LacI family transcriptional regulator|nr:LacI family DNA-binding transcriptional regulator [Candidatus Izemoplasmatales bacterium]MDD4354428.1 LacI family DNA-binding transcriptional regulator [Candidatus Izemoplasmatales bacterium]MDD4987543.1 LacI family DNA-binding transcriptional regulator [Candidatus Izemoplasmatales bacterium]MDD5601426.1 LacI family DNA-binding transcriptional regulator [Candidatus Izemoplasmatales bacterium]NLF48609.1 LacI family transcriptional regulator [Acholeplasmataceae bacterium]